MTHSPKTPRWMKSVLAEAARTQPVLPWVRGPRRAEMTARRASAPVPRAPRLIVQRAG